MTYQDLLTITARKKAEAIKNLNKALEGPCGFLVRAEIKRDPGSVAWSFLAREFCETLAEHISEFFDQDGADSPVAYEYGAIYMAYEDSDPDLYDMLPVEAQLFE